MPLKIEGDIYDYAYQLIGNRYRQDVVTTKDRNRLVEFFGEHLPFYYGDVYELVSKNLGGGVWQVSAKVRKFTVD